MRYEAPPPNDIPMHFMWTGEDDKPVIEADQRVVLKRLTATSQKQTEAEVERAATMGGSFMLNPTWGHHLLQASERVRPWTAQERR